MKLPTGFERNHPQRWLSALSHTLLIVILTAVGCQSPAVASPAPATLAAGGQPAARPPVPGATAAAPPVLEPAPTDGYIIGNPTLTDLYLSPAGDDANDGLTPGTPLRTLTTAWGKIPEGGPLASTGYRINLMPGIYPCEPAEPDDCRNFFSDRQGTYEHPIILRALNGPGSATLRGGMDIYQVSYLYLVELTLVGGDPLPVNASGNNLLHLASVDHILVRGSSVNGPDCPNDGCNNLQEALKVNQSQYIYIEDSVISGASQSGVVDYVSVQYGHFLRNVVHTGGEWCMYIKGGSAYLRIEGNEFRDCHLGFQAGQSTNFAVMPAPWVHYEVYDIKFVNNLMHDLEGVPLSVSGGYNILFAYNTLYHVGYDDEPGYGLLQTVLGERGCSPTDEIPDAEAVCEASIAEGGWGPDFITDSQPVIPNQNVYIYNNLIYNPAPAQTRWSHFGFGGPGDLPDGFHNLPQHPATDNNLVIKGNLIWNGPADHPLGLDETTGCADSNPTCNAAQLIAENTINVVEPQLVNPAGGDLRPLAGGNVFAAATYPLPDFGWETFAPAVPQGTLSNAVAVDIEGAPRVQTGPPGAYSGNAISQPTIYLPLVASSPVRRALIPTLPPAGEGGLSLPFWVRGKSEGQTATSRKS